MSAILIVDDDLSVYHSLRMALGRQHDLLWAADAREAIKLFQGQNPKLVLLDVLMPNIDGLELLTAIREADKSIPVIMLTAADRVKTAVEAMKRGATDYLTKPFEPEELQLIVAKALENHRLESELRDLRNKVDKRDRFHTLVGKSRQMREVYSKIEHLAGTNATVLILGESGTGKELVAKALHFTGPRRERPFVAIHCAAIPETLIESELFGHEKGAFTGALSRKAGQFELADRGTIFLDEVADISMAVQSKLLRVLQEREFTRIGGTSTNKFDVRVIAATNKNLDALMRQGLFRDDLYYRLNVVPIYLSPLRERREDIPLLIRQFLAKKAEEDGREPKAVSRSALELAIHYNWPGNARELENAIEQAMVFSEGSCIEAWDLPSHIKDQVRSHSLKEEILTGRISLDRAVNQLEKEVILDAMRRSNYIQTRAAAILGISRRMLRYRMDTLGITISESQIQESEEPQEQ